MLNRLPKNVLLVAAGVAVCCTAAGENLPCSEQIESIRKAETITEKIVHREAALSCLRQARGFIPKTSFDMSDLQNSTPTTNNHTDYVLAMTGVLERAQTEAENTRDFEDFSVGTGMAVLREPSLDGSNDPIPIVEFHWLMDTWGDNKSVGLGLFGTINAGGRDVNAIDHIGGGLLLSARFDGTNHPLNFGVGYMIDRKGFESEDKAVRGDRSGLFYMLSFNPISAAKFIGGFFVEKK